MCRFILIYFFFVVVIFVFFLFSLKKRRYFFKVYLKLPFVCSNWLTFGCSFFGFNFFVCCVLFVFCICYLFVLDFSTPFSVTLVRLSDRCVSFWINCAWKFVVSLDCCCFCFSYFCSPGFDGCIFVSRFFFVLFYFFFF